MTPEEVYASLLRALGVPGDEVPVTEAEQATAFTSHGPVGGGAGPVVRLPGAGVADCRRALADEPDRAAGQLVGDLTAEGDRLGGLAYDGHWSVRAAFDLSYRR